MCVKLYPAMYMPACWITKCAIIMMTLMVKLVMPTMMRRGMITMINTFNNNDLDNGDDNRVDIGDLH